jgi:hypothetical protein
MDRLTARNLVVFEEHLMICPSCSMRVIEFDDLIAAVRSSKFKKPGLHHRPFQKNVFISHGGPSMTDVEAVCDFLDALAARV